MLIYNLDLFKITSGYVCMHNYEIRKQQDNTDQVWQLRDDGKIRIVSENHHDYIKWLSDGNIPTIIEYQEQIIELPDIETYKMNAKDRIATASANESSNMTVYRSAGLPEKFTENVRMTMLARFTELTHKQISEPLLESENNEIAYLLSIFDKIKLTHIKEFTLKYQIDNASTYEEIDDIVW